MPILIILQLIIIIALVLLFIVGPIVMIIGKAKQNKKVLKIGFVLFFNSNIGLQYRTNL